MRNSENLTSSEEYFRSLFEKNSTAICIVEPDTSISRANNSTCELTGYSMEEIIGSSWLKFVHNEEMERLLEYSSGRLSGINDVPEHFEVRFCKKDGQMRKALVSIVLLSDKRILASMIDITQRIELEQELKRNEEYFRRIFENNSLAIAVVEPDTTISMVNDKLCSMLKYTKDEICGTSWTKYIFHDDLESLKNSFTLGILNPPEKPSSFEFRFIQKDGNIRHALMNVTVTSNKKVIASYLDITERKELETELIKAKDKAQESDRLKSAFLSNMSHEIRTPLNGILGFAELLKEPSLTFSQQQEFINTISKSGERLLSTLNAILDISRIESGMTKVDLVETNINDKLDFNYRFFLRESEEKGLKFNLRKRLLPEESIVYSDNEKINSVLSNLIKNAIKFTAKGIVEFGCEKIAEHLRFFVKDTGKGIPENHAEFIFERFRQGNDSISRNYEGTGLGLSIAKNYVEMLGGRIWFESEVDKGTTFYFTVPYKEIKETRTESRDVVENGRNGIQDRKLKILIAEDDEVSYSLLIRMIRGINSEIFHARDGIGAVQFSRENSDLDLVLMDIRMPGMDGLEATRQIRGFNKELIIIAQTAYGFSSDCEKALEAGCNDYISKPLNKNALNELIRKYC